MPRKIMSNGRTKPRTKAEIDFRNKQILAGIKSQKSKLIGQYKWAIQMKADPKRMNQWIKETFNPYKEKDKRSKNFWALRLALTHFKKLKGREK